VCQHHNQHLLPSEAVTFTSYGRSPDSQSSYSSYLPVFTVVYWNFVMLTVAGAVEDFHLFPS